MPWWGWVLIGLFALGFMGNTGRAKKGRRPAKAGGAKRPDAKTAQQIADEVLTLHDFALLERKVERAEQSLSEATEAGYDRACDRHTLLEEALCIARDKPYRWQFIPSLALDLSAREVAFAYKAVSSEEHEALVQELGKDGWYPITGEDEPEDAPPELAGLRKFRAIIDAGLTREETVKKINALCSTSGDFRSEFFGDSDLKPGDEWFASQMKDDGLPMARELYAEGFTTPKAAWPLTRLLLRREKESARRRWRCSRRIRRRCAAGSESVTRTEDLSPTESAPSPLLPRMSEGGGGQVFGDRSARRDASAATAGAPSRF